MRILVNEKPQDFPQGTTLEQVRARCKPEADLVIHNGFPAGGPEAVAEGDRVVLIRRGEVPPVAELEALLVARHTPGVHARVRQARVGIAGAGGLGSQVALALARTGFGRLVIADFDVVEPSNLNRQQYFVDQIGLPKVAALAATLRRANPYAEVEPHEVRLTRDNIPRLFHGCSVLVEAFDAADQKAMLVETALTRLPETTVVAASGVAGYEPSATVAVHRLGPRLFVVGDLDTAARPGRGLMAPRVGVAAHIQANLVLRLVLGEEQPESRPTAAGEDPPTT